MLRRIAPLLSRIGAGLGVARRERGGHRSAGRERRPGRQAFTSTSTRYFWYHHTDGDTPDKLDPRDVARCVAVFAVYAYVLAESPRCCQNEVNSEWVNE
jgi:carboxypeptidase Q